MKKLESKTNSLRTPMTLLALGFGTYLAINFYNQEFEKTKDILENNLCTEIQYVNIKTIGDYLEGAIKDDKKLSDVDMGSWLSYVSKLNGMKQQDFEERMIRGANFILPVYSKERCVEVEAKRPKSYTEAVNRIQKTF